MKQVIYSISLRFCHCWWEKEGRTIWDEDSSSSIHVNNDAQGLRVSHHNPEEFPSGPRCDCSFFTYPHFEFAVQTSKCPQIIRHKIKIACHVPMPMLYCSLCELRSQFCMILDSQHHMSPSEKPFKNRLL